MSEQRQSIIGDDGWPAQPPYQMRQCMCVGPKPGHMLCPCGELNGLRGMRQWPKPEDQGFMPRVIPQRQQPDDYERNWS